MVTKKTIKNVGFSVGMLLASYGLLVSGSDYMAPVFANTSTTMKDKTKADLFEEAAYAITTFDNFITPGSTMLLASSPDSTEFFMAVSRPSFLDKDLSCYLP